MHSKAKQQIMKAAQKVRNPTSPFLQMCMFLVLLMRPKSSRLVEPETHLSRPGWEQLPSDAPLQGKDQASFKYHVIHTVI